MNKSFCVVQLRKMLFAAVMTMLVMTLTDLIDSILAAQLISHKAMAAVVLVDPLMNFATFVTLLFATGTAYLYSFELGNFKPDVANRLVGQGALLTVGCAVVTFLLVVFGEDIYFSCFSNAETTIAFAREYYAWYRVVFLLWPLCNFMQMIVYADGGGVNCIYATVAEFLTNLLSSIFFASYMEMGMAGIALGTVVGNITSMIIFGKWIFFESPALRPKLYFSMQETVKVVKESYVHASLYLHIALGNMLLNVFFLKTFGEEYFPVLSVIIGVLQLAVCFDGVGEATEPMVDIYLGEGNYDGIAKVMKAATKAAIIFGVATIPIFTCFAASIAKLFGIVDPALLKETVTAIRILSLSMPFLAVLYLYATYYQIMGRVKIAFSVSVCKDFALYVALPVACSLVFGLQGMWIGITLVSVVTCVLFAAFLRMRHKKKFPFLLPESDVISRDALLSMESVISLRNWVEEAYKKRGYNEEDQLKIGLLIEEVGMNIVDKNNGAEVLAELTLFFDDKPKIVIRDNGKHLDMTQDNLQSFRDYFLYSFIHGGNIGNKYLITQNYNRHTFQMRLD